MLPSKVILIDNGHGVETSGKRSPDGLFREYSWCREIAVRIVAELTKKGYAAFLLVKEQNDVCLAERVKRANAYCAMYGASNVLLVSVHNNAAGSGKDWMSARGWECWTSVGKTQSDKLADYFYDSARVCFPLAKLRTDMSDGDMDKESNFYILKHSRCPAVLTENFFQDNKDDVAFLRSSAGKDAVVKCHVDAIIKYMNL